MNGDIEWTLIEDDFLSWVKTQLKILLKAQLKTVDSQSKQESVISLPDIIYYDPFSYKTNPDFWGLEAFSNLYELLDLLSNATTSVLSSANLSDSLLITYSSATRVRAALLAAGFYVYEGIATGPKSTTTLASRIFRNDLKPLGSDWCERWERSDVHFEQDHSKVLERIKNHPQFSL
jgi:queuine tRNA-ribosyltransferase